MRMFFRKHYVLPVSAVLVCAMVASASGRDIKDAAQEQAKPATPAPAEIPSTADAQSQADMVELEPLRKSMRKLTSDVEVLRKRVTDLEKDRLFDVTRVLLLREEQRAEHCKQRFARQWRSKRCCKQGLSSLISR